MSASIENALRGFFVKTANKKLTKKIIPSEKFKSDNIHNILIVSGNKHLHEVILSLPAFKAIRRQFPKAKITAFFEKQFVSFKDQFDMCDVIKPFYRRVLDWPVRDLLSLLKTLKNGFDLVIVFNTKGHSYQDAFLAHYSKAEYILGSELSMPNGEADIDYLPYNLLALAPGKINHASDYYRSVLKRIKIKGYRSINRLPLSDKVKHRAENILKYNGIKPDELIVGIALCPEHDEEPWAIENFVTLAKHFGLHMETKVLTFCSKKNSEFVNSFEAGLPFKPLRTDTYSLIEQAALMQYCSLVVCPNIDYMYLAYSVGTPVIGLFGKQEEKYWRPGKDKFVAINSENEDITTVKTKKVIEAAKTVLREKIFDKEKSMDISDQALEDYLDFGDIVENI